MQAMTEPVAGMPPDFLKYKIFLSTDPVCMNYEYRLLGGFRPMNIIS